jgi:hypothetical protein
MNKVKSLQIWTVLLGMWVSLLFASTATAQAEEVIELTFQKSAAAQEGNWEGTVSGDVEGNLRTVLLNADTTDPVWQVEFDWIIESGDRSFTARMSGTLNTETGAVAMQGEVIEGWMLGAPVQEEGQMVDAETSTFEGTIRIMTPAPQTLPVTGGASAGATFDLHSIIAWVLSLLQ